MASKLLEKTRIVAKSSIKEQERVVGALGATDYTADKIQKLEEIGRAHV